MLYRCFTLDESSSAVQLYYFVKMKKRKKLKLITFVFSTLRTRFSNRDYRRIWINTVLRSFFNFQEKIPRFFSSLIIQISRPISPRVLSSKMYLENKIEKHRKRSRGVNIQKGQILPKFVPRRTRVRLHTHTPYTSNAPFAQRSFIIVR